MCNYLGSTAIQRDFALAVPLCATAWLFVTAPTVLTTSSFIALVGLFFTFGWVAKTTYLNSQPTSSLAQLLHHVTEHSNLVEDRRDDR
jgi:hypothetical protein